VSAHLPRFSCGLFRGFRVYSGVGPVPGGRPAPFSGFIRVLFGFYSGRGVFGTCPGPGARALPCASSEIPSFPPGLARVYPGSIQGVFAVSSPIGFTIDCPAPALRHPSSTSSQLLDCQVLLGSYSGFTLGVRGIGAQPRAVFRGLFRVYLGFIRGLFRVCTCPGAPGARALPCASSEIRSLTAASALRT
jgi:hypothetical protein